MGYSITVYSNGREAPIAELAKQGRLESPYAKYDFSDETLSELMGLATIFVLVHGDTPAGFLAAVINDRGPILKGTKVAAELFLYVSPEHRGSHGSVKLINTYEDWAKANGCRLASMCNMRNEYMERLGTLYQRLGYHKAEETYLKELV